jgi:hypothetical protein
MKLTSRLQSFTRRIGSTNSNQQTSNQTGDCHRITISEATPRSSISDDGQASIRIKIRVDQADVTPPSHIRDPFSPNEHDECEWYLDKWLRVKKYDRDRAERISPAVRAYGGNLLQQLQWHGFVFFHPEIRIDIRQNVNRTNKSAIYHIHWEQLEQLEGPTRWPGLDANPPQVTVRRVTDPPPIRKPRDLHVETYKPTKEINILLIIAREMKPEQEVDLEDVSPALAQRSIMNIRRLLTKRSRHNIINLEVVRPGSFEALADHLARKSAEKGLGYFHFVHFDLHGEVNNREE